MVEELASRGTASQPLVLDSSPQLLIDDHPVDDIKMSVMITHLGNF